MRFNQEVKNDRASEGASIMPLDVNSWISTDYKNLRVRP